MSPRRRRERRVARYLLFADILGTRELYVSVPPKCDLIEWKRSALGHAVRTAVFPYFQPKFRATPCINIFSDTVLVATSNLRVLLQAAAKLFHIFSAYTFTANGVEEIYLLRGGISRGQILSSNAITSTKNVSVADIFDTSLEYSYRLEGLRKGSRIFLSEEAYSRARRLNFAPCTRWLSITGLGEPVSPAFEFLWPAVLFNYGNEFRDSLLKLFHTWRRLFCRKESWMIPEYNAKLYQLDETIKLFLRSAVYAPAHQVRRTISSAKMLLPLSDPTLTKLDIQFTWGTWFQVLRTVLLLHKRHPTLVAKGELHRIVGRTLKDISALGYTRQFMHELASPDYASFKDLLLRRDLLL